MRHMLFYIIVLTASLVLLSSIWAGESFRYKFESGEVMFYLITIDSDLEIRELGSLARMMNLDRIKHNASIDVELLVENVGPGGEAAIRATFGRVSLVMVAGDSAYVDDGSSWGAIKPGSQYGFMMSPRGEIISFSGKDTIAARQGAQMVQRFFPVFPEDLIEPGHSWSDSISFELELPGDEPSEILASISYSYTGNLTDGYYLFDFETDGQTHDDTQIRLSGSGDFKFDNSEGRLTENSGDFVIDSEIDLSAFGLPRGLGTVPVNIQSKIIFKFQDDE